MRIRCGNNLKNTVAHGNVEVFRTSMCKGISTTKKRSSQGIHKAKLLNEFKREFKHPNLKWHLQIGHSRNTSIIKMEI